jgi:glycosyltransferase involved in cell wall biosynthesis
VLSQGYRELEYIVIDGGSTDGSIDIIRRHEKHLAYWISEKDRGPADALSKGLSRATGTILAYLNSDDLYMRDSLTTIAEAMKDPNVDVAYGNMYWIDTDGKNIGEQRQTRFMPMGYLYGGATLQQPATFWKRDLYSRCGGIDASYQFAYDTDLFVRFALRGARFKYINRFVASFRIHAESKSSNQAAVCAQELQRLRQTHLPFPFKSLRATSIRAMTTVKRSLWYTAQGDLIWLLKRIPDRLRARNAQAIVGPHGRRM